MRRRARGAEIGRERLVTAGHQGRRDDKIGRRAVARDRNVPHHGDAQQGLDVRIVWLGLERIPEEDQTIDLAFGDAGADLLVAAERAALKFVDRQPELLLEQMAGGAGREELVGGEEIDVESGPLEQLELLVVVGDQGDRARPGGGREQERNGRRASCLV
jgi:hypothetical protein